MIKNTLLLLLVSLALPQLNAQINCPPLEFCVDATLYCGHELENNVFNNNVPEGGGQDASCGISPHNSVWLRFIPCSTNLELNISHISCVTGDGLQAAIFTDCFGGNEIACDEGQENGFPVPLNLQATLQPNQEYWLMVDGYIGDVCDFEIDILSGIDTMAPAPSPGGPFPGTITGNLGSVYCGAIGTGIFTVTWPDCETWSASAFSCVPDECQCIEWTIPLGAVILDDPCGSTVTIDFSGTPPGIYTITATPKCYCQDYLCIDCGLICCPAMPVTKVISITSPSVLQLPEIPICAEDDFPYCVYEPGGFTNGTIGWCQIPDPANCQYIRQNYRKKNPIFTNLGNVLLCDTVWLCGIPLTQPGTYVETCNSVLGCDSTILINLTKDPNCIFNCPNLNMPAPPGDSCHASPLLCGNYLANYCGSNAGLTDDVLAGNLYENAGFLRFLPCLDSISLRVGVSNCAVGSTGLAFNLFESECDPGAMLSSINIYQNEFVLLNLGNLVADSNYTLMVSGIQNSECAFSVEVLYGIGTADIAPEQCTCTDGGVTGPGVICPGELYTFSVDFPDCTFTGGGPIGGNGYVCNPPEACPEPDSFRIVWHLPQGMHFVGDSTGFQVTAMLDSNYFDLDTIRWDSVWVSWELISPGGAVDSLVHCDCQGPACFANFNALPVQIMHDIQIENCILSCLNTVCLPWNITQAGVYVSDVDNCTRVILTVLQDQNPPSISIAGNTVICEGESTSLQVVPDFLGYFYVWDNGQTGPTITVSPPQTTIYTVTVTDLSNGCTNIAQIQVQVLPVVLTDLGTVGIISCTQPCVEVLGQIYCQPGSYFMYTGLCDQVWFNIGADNSLQIENLPPVSICEGECFNFNGNLVCSDSVASFVQNCTLFLQQVVVLPAYTNNLGVVGYVSCAQPCFEFQGNTYCQPGIYAQPEGQCGEQVFEIVFQKETQQLGQIGVLTCLEPCFQFEGQEFCQAGSYTVEDSCFIKQFSLSEDFSTPQCSNPIHECQSNNTHFTVGFSISGQAPFRVNEVEINGSNYLSPPMANGTNYAYTVKQANGCATAVNGAYDCAANCLSDAGDLAATLLHACAGQSTVVAITLSPVVFGPNDVVSYQLETGGGSVLIRNASGIFDFDPDLLIPEETYFILRLVGQPDVSGLPDQNSACTDTSSRQPAVFHAPPSIQIVGDNSFCVGNTIQLNAIGAATIHWSNGQTDASIEMSASAPQIIALSVEGQNEWGCIDTATATLKVLENPVLTGVISSPPACYGEESGFIEIQTASGGVAPLQFALNNGIASENRVFQDLAPGTYALMVEDAMGCQSDTLVTLDEPALFTLDIGPDRVIKLGDTVHFQAVLSIPNAQLSWINDYGQSQTGGLHWTFQPGQTTLVRCEGLDDNNCLVWDEALVKVEIREGVYKPNVLKPGALNLQNQYFTIYAAEGWIKNIEQLSIYDRWGALVWQKQGFPANMPEEGWDGRFQGQSAAPGVYVYYGVLLLADGSRQTIKGDVTLVR